MARDDSNDILLGKGDEPVYLRARMAIATD